MVYLPKGIFVDIVRRVGKQGFRELAPFIASGPDGKDAVFEKEVLKEVDLDEFIFVSSLANEGSVFRPFFMKCFVEGNVTAMYVEGLRLAVKNGPSDESLDLLHIADDEIIYASFAFAVFLIASGYYEEGMGCIQLLAEKVSWLETLVDIADTVMAQIADIEPLGAGHYEATYRYPDGDIPNCVHFACTMEDVCFDCIGYWYSRRVVQLC